MIGTILSIVIPIACIGAILYFVMGGRTKGVKSSTSERPDTAPEHHPTPAAAHAAPGHGGGHDDHDDGHGHSLPWSSQWIAVMLVAFVLLSIGFAVVWWANRQPKPTVVDHTPPAAVSTSAPTKGPCDTLPDPANIREVTVPVEGESEMVPVPSGYLPCYGPYKIYQKLRFKAGNGDTPPSEWGDRESENKWLGIIPGESSEPLTAKVWFVLME